jgi:hypothetical protein
MTLESYQLLEKSIIKYDLVTPPMKSVWEITFLKEMLLTTL